LGELIADSANLFCLHSFPASMGNESCKVVVWFDKCGAYASSNEKYGIGWGDSEEGQGDGTVRQRAVSRRGLRLR